MQSTAAPTPSAAHARVCCAPSTEKAMASRAKTSKSKHRLTSARAAARNSQSRPAKPLEGAGDALAELAAGQQQLAEHFPFNAQKAAEHGRDNAIAPPEGDHAALPLP